MTTTPPPPAPAAIGLVVSDMSAALAFFRRLGLRFPADIDDHMAAELAPGLRLMLDTEDLIRSFNPGWQRPVGSPRVSIAFEVAEPAAVDATFAELIDAGYHGERAPWDAFWGQRYATVLDPDGNGVDLFAALPAPAA